MSESGGTEAWDVPPPPVLRELWSQGYSLEDDLYDVRREVGKQLIAISREGHPALIVRVRGFEARPGRVVGKVKLRFLQGAELSLGEDKTYADVAAFECLEPSVVDTFAALATELLHVIGPEEAEPAEIIEAFVRWHDLLASRERLSAESALGLWGELAVLDRAPSVDGAEAAWIGPSAGVMDFLRDKTGLEVKTSPQRRRHTLRFSQALFGKSEFDAYLVSLWVQENESGATLPDLVDQIADRLTDETGFRKKVLGLGYRAEHADEYDTRWVLVEAPAVFRMKDVPHVAASPDGVSNLRWEVDLNGKTAADEAELVHLLARISGERS